MELRDCVTLPAAIGIGLTRAAVQTAQEMRHAGEIRRAQHLVNRYASNAQTAAAATRAADRDYRALLAELSASRQREATLAAALEESDREALELALEVRRLRERAATH